MKGRCTKVTVHSCAMDSCYINYTLYLCLTIHQVMFPLLPPMYDIVIQFLQGRTEKDKNGDWEIPQLCICNDLGVSPSGNL